MQHGRCDPDVAGAARDAEDKSFKTAIQRDAEGCLAEGSVWTQLGVCVTAGSRSQTGDIKSTVCVSAE